MCRMSSCCCCLNMRQGTLATAVYTIVFGILSLGGNVYRMSQEKDQVEMCRIRYGNRCPEVNTTQYYSSIGVAACWLLTALFLILGVIKKIRCLFIPWMIVDVLFIIGAGYVVVIFILAFSVVFSTFSTAFLFILCLVILLVNIYCLIAVCSYYRIMPTEEMEPVPPVEFKA